MSPQREDKGSHRLDNTVWNAPYTNEEMSRKRVRPISSLATKWSEDESIRKKTTNFQTQELYLWLPESGARVKWRKNKTAKIKMQKLQAQSLCEEQQSAQGSKAGSDVWQGGETVESC